MGDFKVLSAPKERAFTDAVLTMLKKCPIWKPARLANGKVVSLRYEVPILFKRY